VTQGRNPFRYLRPVPPQEFLGRWSMVEEIALDLTFDDGDSHACIGGRRSGKSSLLAALHHYLCQPETHKGDHLVLPILVDFKRTFSSEAAFFAHLLQEVRRRVDANSRSRLRDPSPVKVSLDQSWLDSLLTSDPRGLSLTKFEEALSHVLDQLYQADGPTRFIFLMDEVDDVLSCFWRQVLFSQLRSLIYAGDLSDNMRLVLSGSRRFLDSVTDRGSPLWNILKLHYLTAFDEPTTYELITRADNVPQAVQQAVWQQSGGHPFLAQYLLHHLWQEGLDQATETTIAQIVNRFLHEEQAHLEGWANAIEEIGLRLYGHFVDQSGWLDEMDLIRAADDAPNVVKRGLVALSYHGLIIHDGSWSRYRRAGDLFRQWFLSQYQSQQKKGEQDMELPPDARIQAISFLFDIGRWAASELKERWTLARQKKKAEQAIEVDLSKTEEEVRQQAEALIYDLVAEHGVTEIKRVLKLVEQRRKLIFEWEQAKLDHEEEYNRGRIQLDQLRRNQEDLDEKIARAMAEIETDLKGLGVQVKKEKAS